jgi:prepilin signal peptidase PulO-like enzyme (type II secretory pathway)
MYSAQHAARAEINSHKSERGNALDRPSTSAPLAYKRRKRYAKNNKKPEAHMNDILLYILSAVLGMALALPLQYIYNIFPEPWLQDYDYDPKAPDHRLSRRMKFLPHTLILMIALAVFFFCSLYVNRSFVLERDVFHFLLMLLPLLPFSLIVISDQLNRIIPDQLVAAVALLSVFGFLADHLEGSLWIASDAAWYAYALNRILGALIGAGILWGIGILGSWVSGQESMGFGDVKLMFACGLLSGIYGLGFVFFIAFVLGGLFAVPLYIHKRKRIRLEEKMISESVSPDKMRKYLNRQKNNIHYSEDPDYIAFGPFLALGTAAFLIFETPLRAFFETNIMASADLLF